MKKIIVNPGWGILIFALFLAGCGFQLNRHRVQLPENARSISIDKIENSSYVPLLNIYLRDLLTERLVQNSVKLASSLAADLSLSFVINSTASSRNEYALTSDTQSFEFLFSVTGTLTISNNIKNTFFIKPQSLTGSYAIKSEKVDLNQTEIEEGRFKALMNLRDKIIAKFTQNF